MASTNVVAVVNNAFIQVSLKLRQTSVSFFSAPQHPPDLTGPNVQKVKAGVKRSAGCVMIVLVALMMPMATQRLPNAYEGLHRCMFIVCQNMHIKVVLLTYKICGAKLRSIKR